MNGGGEGIIGRGCVYMCAWTVLWIVATKKNLRLDHIYVFVCMGRFMDCIHQKESVCAKKNLCVPAAWYDMGIFFF